LRASYARRHLERSVQCVRERKAIAGREARAVPVLSCEHGLPLSEQNAITERAIQCGGAVGTD